MTYSFLNDYSEGCHPDILSAIAKHNEVQEKGYGEDKLSEQARGLIKEKIQQPNAGVYFVTTGTQANLVCLAAMLKPFEAIIAPVTGHINANEAGAIEATGHKIISVVSPNGKLTPDDITRTVTQFSLHPHMVRVKVVYISNATELGTVYSLAELAALSACCRHHNLFLFMDGARLAAALASQANDMTLADVAALTDMFWFGGTKSGALFGEAIVINNNLLKKDFDFHLKQRGALLAKGRTLGAQFVTLLQDDLYLDLARHANSMAVNLANALVTKGYDLIAEVESNQIFIKIPNKVIDRLSQKFTFYVWEKCDNQSSLVRFVTSWATQTDKVNELIQLVKET